MVEPGVGQDTGSFMTPKLGNVIPLFINVRKLIGLLFTSGHLHNLPTSLTDLTLHLVKFYSSHFKMLMWK